MVLTRRTFKDVGSILRKRKASDEIIGDFVDLFGRSNPRFDEQRFRNYVKDNTFKTKRMRR